MINLSFDKLRLIAQIRNISGYKNESKEDLIKALSEPKPETPKPEKTKSEKLKPETPKPAKPKPEKIKPEKPKSEKIKPETPKFEIRIRGN